MRQVQWWELWRGNCAKITRRVLRGALFHQIFGFTLNFTLILSSFPPEKRFRNEVKHSVPSHGLPKGFGHWRRQKTEDFLRQKNGAGSWSGCLRWWMEGTFSNFFYFYSLFLSFHAISFLFFIFILIILHTKSSW